VGPAVAVLDRLAVCQETRKLIRQMSRDNPLWGAPRIHGELLKPGIDIGETSVAKYMVRGRNRRKRRTTAASACGASSRSRRLDWVSSGFGVTETREAAHS
jgi:hypothetical protein